VAAAASNGEPRRRVGLIAIALVMAAFLADCANSQEATPAVQLRHYLDAHPEAIVHSDWVVVGERSVVLVGLAPSDQDRRVVVLGRRQRRVDPVATIELPFPYFTLLPNERVPSADVTGDGRPDFLVALLGGDTTFGVVVSDDEGPWRLVPVSNDDTGDVYLGGGPRFDEKGRLVATSNDCLPDCAHGHSEEVLWTYDRLGRNFTAPRSSSLGA